MFLAYNRQVDDSEGGKEITKQSSGRMVKPTFDKKSMPMVAWYVLSNVSYMYRVIKDVLPTIRYICHQFSPERTP